MAIVIPTGHYQALIPLKHDRVTRPAAITFGIRDEDTGLDPTDLADAILNTFSSAFLTSLDNEVEAGPVRLTFDQGDQGRGSIVGNDKFTGGRTGTSLASNTAVLVRKNTSRIGRPGRGKMFLPWMTGQAGIDEVGVLTTPTLTAMNAAADAWLTAIQTAEMQMVILHDENVPGTTTPSLVTSLTVDPTAGTQRRRMRF